MAECVINMDLFEGSVSLHQIDNLEHLINKHIGYDSSSCPLVGRSVFHYCLKRQESYSFNDSFGGLVIYCCFDLHMLFLYYIPTYLSM